MVRRRAREVPTAIRVCRVRLVSASVSGAPIVRWDTTARTMACRRWGVSAPHAPRGLRQWRLDSPSATSAPSVPPIHNLTPAPTSYAPRVPEHSCLHLVRHSATPLVQLGPFSVQGLAPCVQRVVSVSQAVHPLVLHVQMELILLRALQLVPSVVVHQDLSLLVERHARCALQESILRALPCPPLVAIVLRGRIATPRWDLQLRPHPTFALGVPTTLHRLPHPINARSVH